MEHFTAILALSSLLVIKLLLFKQSIRQLYLINGLFSKQTDWSLVLGASRCYYNFQHYEEGDRIVTNEPCLNCTCHKRMLMCYLRVCPFTKAVGQDCTVEKRPDQCCPVITCPQGTVTNLSNQNQTYDVDV